VLISLSTAGVAHLAAHGRLSAENPLFSEIALAAGVHTGDELIGLGATFLARGATHLVASVVPSPTRKPCR